MNDGKVEENADVPGNTSNNCDMISYSIKKAISLQTSGEIAIIDARKENECATTQVIPPSFTMPTSFKPGWAVWPKRGEMYGRQYVSNYMDDINKLFNQGVNKSSEKNIPGAMLEVLQKTYPNRFNIPSETEIRQAISTLIQGNKQKHNAKKAELTQYLDFIEQAVKANPNIKPMQGLALFQQHFGPGSVEILSDGQIKSRISRRKAITKNSDEMKEE